MKKWIITLLSNSNDADEKRLISLGSFLVLCLMVVLNAFEIRLDPNLIYVFAALCSGSGVLTVIDKLRK